MNRPPFRKDFAKRRPGRARIAGSPRVHEDRSEPKGSVGVPQRPVLDETDGSRRQDEPGLSTHSREILRSETVGELLARRVDPVLISLRQCLATGKRGAARTGHDLIAAQAICCFAEGISNVFLGRAETRRQASTHAFAHMLQHRINWGRFDGNRHQAGLFIYRSLRNPLVHHLGLMESVKGKDVDIVRPIMRAGRWRALEHAKSRPKWCRPLLSPEIGFESAPTCQINLDGFYWSICRLLEDIKSDEELLGRAAHGICVDFMIPFDIGLNSRSRQETQRKRHPVGRKSAAGTLRRTRSAVTRRFWIAFSGIALLGFVGAAAVIVGRGLSTPEGANGELPGLSHSRESSQLRNGEVLLSEVLDAGDEMELSELFIFETRKELARSCVRSGKIDEGVAIFEALCFSSSGDLSWRDYRDFARSLADKECGAKAVVILDEASRRFPSHKDELMGEIDYVLRSSSSPAAEQALRQLGYVQ